MISPTPLINEAARATARTVSVVVVSILALAGIVALLVKGGGSDAATAEAGLPKGQIYSSLLAVGENPETILLGTGEGAFASTDGGRTWQRDGLDGMIVMNLSTAGGNVVWAAGHELLARSTGGAESWQSVWPDGLPHLDIHAFAASPDDTDTLWAALSAASAGLYRSTDGGRSFSLVTSQIGGGFMALAVTPRGRVLAADGLRGLIASTDEGSSWRTVLEADVTDIAASPEDPNRILIAADGVLLSTDGGESWKRVLGAGKATGPLAWSSSDPRVAYAVGLRRTLYRSVDGGASWSPTR